MNRAINKAAAKPLFHTKRSDNVARKVSNSLIQLDNLDANDFLSSYCQQKLTFLEQENSLCLLLNQRAEIVYLNRYGSELLGIEPTSVFGACWMTQFILPEQRTEVLLIFEQIIRSQTEAYRDYFGDVRSINWDILPIQWNNNILKNKHGHVLGIFSQGSDLLSQQFLI